MFYQGAVDTHKMIFDMYKSTISYNNTVWSSSFHLKLIAATKLLVNILSLNQTILMEILQQSSTKFSPKQTKQSKKSKTLVCTLRAQGMV